MTKIRCSHCGGTGHAPLSSLMEKTLGAVSDDFESTAVIRKRAGVDRANDVNAILNRLNWLKARMLVEVKRIGPAKLWKRVK